VINGFTTSHARLALSIKERTVEHLPPFDPPEQTGWERAWHGYYYKAATLRKASRGRCRGFFDREEYHETALEAFALMSVLEEIGPNPITFFELGAGRAPWCMAVAGVVRFGLVPSPPISYRLLAVEAEPAHYEWGREHLLSQDIAAEFVYGAVTGDVGVCRFDASTDPVEHMGQAVRTNGNIEVPCFTIDHLRESHGFDRIDLVHMDIQGMEVEAVRGAKRSLAEQRIDYLIVGTHGRSREYEVARIMAATHDLIVELPADGSLRLEGFTKPFHSTGGDGVQVYRRKRLGRGRED
jgi:FkbM family methyltransferase